MIFHSSLNSDSQQAFLSLFSSLNISLPRSVIISPINLSIEGKDWFVITELGIKISFDYNCAEMMELRRLLVKPVSFVGGGPGDPELITIAGKRALQKCDICFYDALIDPELLKHLPSSAKAVYVGKRCHVHSARQREICQLLIDASRNGLRVVRLKGGDSGIFGRLTEETEVLTELELPFRLVPGISSFIAATTGTGLLLTRREVARGFRIQTPRGAEGKIVLPNKQNLPATDVFFMAIGCLDDLAKAIIDSGREPSTPVAIIFSAGTKSTKTVCGNLLTISGKVGAVELSSPKPPGLIIVGASADESFLYKRFSPLHNKRILFCNPEKREEKVQLIEDLGGTAVFCPIYKERVLSSVDLQRLSSVKSVLISSKLIAETLIYIVINDESFDIRSLPELICSNKESRKILRQFGLTSVMGSTADLTIIYNGDSSVTEMSLTEIASTTTVPNHDFAILNDLEQKVVNSQMCFSDESIPFINNLRRISIDKNSYTIHP